MRTVALQGKKAAGRLALVDDEDYGLVTQWQWRVVESRRKEGRRIDGPYALGFRKIDGRRVDTLMHKLITGWPRTDHIDHNGLNNQRSNLRTASNAQNNYNQRPCVDTSSQYKGVTWNRRCGKWQASIKVGGKSHYLGLYEVEADAAQAYDIAAIEAFGEYAYLNIRGAA